MKILLAFLVIVVIALLCLLPDIIYAIKHKDEETPFYDDEDTYIG